ncbi:MAG TPA: hypothetical protein VK963_00155 [Candidatus Saccharimonadales bacterium]|nr:hypothetical protein [Candidatus Saccharimonadales bacterium]
MKKLVLRFRAGDRAVFNAIKDGTKTVETRAATVRYRGAGVGDIFVMVCGMERLEKQIIAVRHFNNVNELLEVIDWKKIAPQADSKETLMADYRRWYGAKIDQAGLVAFELA